MNRQGYITDIIKLLTRLPGYVESCNKLNLTDINNFSEDFYENLLNIIYGYELKNANKFERNAPALDLRDSDNRIAFQVTSTSSLSKTRDTVEKFNKYELYKQYDRLIILNIVKKSKHKEKNIGGDEFGIDTEKDVQDIHDILNDIKHITDIDLIKKIHSFLVNELVDEPITTLPNEVQTILKIIEHLSDEKPAELNNNLMEDPDPEGKILRRFSEHAEYLTNRFTDLYIEYGQILKTINNENDFGYIALRRAGTYLKGHSDELLTIHDGNPRDALKALIENFKKNLSENGFTFDAGAAEFYIIDQLITCNVFPERATQNA